MWEQFERTLVEGATLIGVELSAEQVNLMRLHAERVREHNEKVNLTEITGEQEMAVKHYIDSLTCLPLIWQGARLVDVGTGAGYPGIPLKIARPDLKLTLLDSLRKRTTFLRQVISSLCIEAEVVHMRTEEYGRGPGREAFDVAVARAVARANVLSEYCLPLVRVGGVFIAMKGPASEPELDEARRAIGLLGGSIQDIIDLELPYAAGKRRLIVIKKVAHTPSAYPRKAGQPEKKPL